MLVKQQRVNKWTTPFEKSQPYKVVEKHGNSVVLELPDGVHYKRSTTHVKPFKERESDPEEAAPQVPAIYPEEKEICPDEKGLHRVEEEWQAAEETLKQGHREEMPNRKTNQRASPRDRCVSDVRQRDMEIML